MAKKQSRRDRKKQEFEEEIESPKEEKLVEERWSFLRVIIGALVVLTIVGLAGYFFLSGTKNAPRVLGSQTEQVPGISSTRPDVKLPTQDVQGILKQVQKQLTNITADNLVSSQAAIQKVISDLQKLQKGDEDRKQVLCDLVCKDK